MPQDKGQLPDIQTQTRGSDSRLVGVYVADTTTCKGRKRGSPHRCSQPVQYYPGGHPITVYIAYKTDASQCQLGHAYQ